MAIQTRSPGLDSWQLPSFSLSSILPQHLKKSFSFWREARIKAEILLLDLSENFLQWKILVNVQTSNDVATGNFQCIDALDVLVTEHWNSAK